MRFDFEADSIRKTLHSMFAAIESVGIKEAYMGGFYLEVTACISNENTYLADKLTCDMNIEEATKQIAKELDIYVEVTVRPSVHGYTLLRLSQMMLAC